MLDYAGLSTLPTAVPGTAAPLPNRVEPVIHPAGPTPLPPNIADAIQLPQVPLPGNVPVAPPQPPSPNPQDHDWITETQSDGTLLLRLKNPDGSPGPVVKIITGVKVPGAEAV